MCKPLYFYTVAFYFSRMFGDDRAEDKKHAEKETNSTRVRRKQS
jgi:hypothetical protein